MHFIPYVSWAPPSCVTIRCVISAHARQTKLAQKQFHIVHSIAFLMGRKVRSRICRWSYTWIDMHHNYSSLSRTRPCSPDNQRGTAKRFVYIVSYAISPATIFMYDASSLIVLSKRWPPVFLVVCFCSVFTSNSNKTLGFFDSTPPHLQVFGVFAFNQLPKW